MPVKIFFCYAHEDEPLLNKLKAHLRPLQRQGLIDVWYDRDISAGTEWEREISEQLNSAQIILLLISPDFMDSDYCYSIEMKRALERYKRGKAHVIPIILRPVHWQIELLGKLQALPTDGIPVTDPSWHDWDGAFFNVTEGIHTAIKKMTTEASAKPPIPLVRLRLSLQHFKNSRKIGIVVFILILALASGFFAFINSRAGKNLQSFTPTAATTQTVITITNSAPQNLYIQSTGGSPALDDSMSLQDSIHFIGTSAKGDGGCFFAGGAYHAWVQVNGDVLWCPATNTNFSNFAYQVQMTIIKGDSGGIIFRFATNSTGNSFGYGFNIAQNGTYDFYSVDENEGFTHLRSGTSLFIKTGLNQTNLIAVLAHGKNIYLFVNGQYVASVNDSSYSSGQIGVQAGENAIPTEAVFRNAQVWEI
jgi:hypothetical protein